MNAIQVLLAFLFRFFTILILLQSLMYIKCASIASPSVASAAISLATIVADLIGTNIVNFIIRIVWTSKKNVKSQPSSIPTNPSSQPTPQPPAASGNQSKQ